MNFKGKMVIFLNFYFQTSHKKMPLDFMSTAFKIVHQSDSRSKSYAWFSKTWKNRSFGAGGRLLDVCLASESYRMLAGCSDFVWKGSKNARSQDLLSDALRTQNERPGTPYSNRNSTLTSFLYNQIATQIQQEVQPTYTNNYEFIRCYGGLIHT